MSLPNTSLPGTSLPASALLSHWHTLYTSTLPHLAATHAPAQRHWPVHLDHCFARIIYDNVIGKGEMPWTTVLKSPAIKHMSRQQLEACIKMAEGICEGSVDLAQMDGVSLRARGKAKTAKRSGEEPGEAPGKNVKIQKLGRGARQPDIRLAMVRAAPSAMTAKSEPTSPSDPLTPPRSPSSPCSAPSPSPQSLILTSALSPFRKRVLLALCQVPAGHYTTYAALSAFLSSSPRAVGNAMRNNPFAPTVPCHRVLAADGSIGGFCGEWGAGEKVGMKVELLRGEGVRFDGRGRVVGGVWRGFV